jgi:hypothetical protein
MSLALFVMAIGAIHRMILVSSDGLAAVYSKVLVALTNTERSDVKLNELTINPLLEQAASLKANDMATNGYFAHYGPDGTTPWNWIDKTGYKYDLAGENLAIDFTDSDDVSKAWMNSPAHRANILNSRFTEIGIATAKGNYNGHPTTFVVQMFGHPKKNITNNIVTSISPNIAEADALSTSSKATDTLVFKKATSSVLGAEIDNSVVSNNDYLVTNPSKIVYVILGSLFTIIFIGLICLIFFEYRKQDPKHRINAVLILVFLIVCTYVYTNYIAPKVVIGGGENTQILLK